MIGGQEMRVRGGVDMTMGGVSWAGYRFASWGNARDWRILTPAGAAITAAEVEAIPGNSADLAYLC